MLAGPFNAVKPAVGSGGTKSWGWRGDRRSRAKEKRRDDERERETMLERPALRKILASNSVYTRQPRRTPFMILRNQATGVSDAFFHFLFFFFFHRHAKYTLFCEDRWFNVWRSHPGNRKYCPSSVQSSRDNFTYKRNCKLEIERI